MAATKQEIRQWVHNGYATGASHVLIVCDTFDHEDYPVYVGGSDFLARKRPLSEILAAYGGQYGENNMQRIMELYSMALELEPQLLEQRAWHE